VAADEGDREAWVAAEDTGVIYRKEPGQHTENSRVFFLGRAIAAAIRCSGVAWLG
jgi:hypothetical protein